MPINAILSALEHLVQIHESLLQLSITKTERLKTGRMDQFQDILTSEQKHLQAIDKFEAQRLKAVDEWASEHQLEDSDGKNVTTILAHLSDQTERDKLEKLSTQLAETLVELKAQEGLNQELTQQSLQFVQMNLAMLSPTIEQVNYGNKNNPNDSQVKRSVFDSKV